jgi:phenylacetate-CoA ligase
MVEDRLHRWLSWYMAAPEPVRRVAGNVYRAMPTRLRHGRTYQKHRRTLNAGGPATWNELDVALDSTLRQLVNVPAYAAWHDVLRSQAPAWERLARLPVRSKTDIKRDVHACLNTSVPANRRVSMHTGGSTEHPMQFFLTQGQTRPRETAYIDHIDESLLRRRPGQWVLSLRGRSVASAEQQGGRLWTVEPIKQHLLFSSDHLERRFMPEYLRSLHQLRPTVIHAFASALYPLARWLNEHPCPEFTNGVQGILLTSESIYDFQFEAFARCFPNAALVSHYGHSERVLMATAQGQGPYEFFARYGYPELLALDSDTPITEPGVVGELVGTGYDNDAMPFVRYRTGDLGVWAQAPTPGHGEARFVMQRIEGRRQEFVVCSDHRLVSITTLGAAHFSDLAQVEAIQFEQRVPGHVTLRVACATPPPEAWVRRIENAVWQKTQHGCRAVVDVVQRIERTARGKHRMLVQHIDLSPYFGASPEFGTPSQQAAQ